MSWLKKLKEFRSGGVMCLACRLALWRKIHCRGNEEKRLRFYDLHTQLLRARILEHLKKRYLKFALQKKQELDRAENTLPHTDGENIWGLWWQGIEDAPDLVKVCHESVRRELGKTHRVVMLDQNSYRDYVTLPKDIIARFERGELGVQVLSDLIRLELLIKYGGTWVDATIFVSCGDLPEYMLKDELFFFQMLFPATWGSPTKSESWFLHATSNHKFLMLVKSLMYKYLQDQKYLCDYHLFYDLMELAIEVYPEVYRRIVPHGNENIHILQSRMFWPFDERTFGFTLQNAKLHKLNWRFSQEDAKKEGTYYRYLLEHYPKYKEETTT